MLARCVIGGQKIERIQHVAVPVNMNGVMMQMAFSASASLITLFSCDQCCKAKRRRLLEFHFVAQHLDTLP